MLFSDLDVDIVFERNFAGEIARMGVALEYQTSPYLSPLSQTSSPTPLNGTFSSSLSPKKSHQRNHSSSTITSSNVHLPLALPSISDMDETAPLSSNGTLTNTQNPLQLSVASHSSHTLEGPLRSPRSKLSVRGDRPHVNFALPNHSKDSGRTSPAPSSVPITVPNGTLPSDRPTSFLSRLSSIRKKRF